MAPDFLLLLIAAAARAYIDIWWWAPALSGLALLPAINALRCEKDIQALFFAAASLPGALVVLTYYALPPIWLELVQRPFELPHWHVRVFAWSFAFGLFISIVWLRHGVQLFDSLIDKLSVKTALERNKKTDIRYIDKILPPAIKPFDPTSYFAQSKGTLIGLDERRKPIYCDGEVFDESHLLFCGRTRSGKGVGAQTIGVQSIRNGELFVVLDPKLDRWMPHVYSAAAMEAGQPYVFLDLRQSAQPQINPFDGANVEEIENLLLAAFSLAERGDAADFYRVGDRRAALECARLVVEMQGSQKRTPTAAEIMTTETAAAWKESAANFWGYMMEMAELRSVNAKHGLSLNALIESGGCLYILGDMQNSRVIRMQRLFMLRLMQLAKRRVEDTSMSNRVIRVFADEFTVHISRPFLVSLAAAAGWRLCVILAFQTLGDLADCPMDLTPETVKAKVWENCALKLVYAVRDSDTADWLARSTGIIQVDDEMRRVDRNVALSEYVTTDRSLRQSESFLVDVNMLLALPKGCGVLLGATRLPKYCYTSPIPVKLMASAMSPTHVDVNVIDSNEGSLAAAMVDLD